MKMKTKSLLMFGLALISCRQANAGYLPEFEANPVNRTFAPISQKADIRNFRILIFPHFGVYSVPQGREASATSVTITSSAECVAFKAELDSTLEWQRVGEQLGQSAKFTITAGSQKNIYYHCPQPFRVNRASNLISIEYSGDFVAAIDAKTVQLINIVDSDTYLKGVVPSEVESKWPMEALKAQAIAARTYAWWTIVRSRTASSLFDMDDTVTYQAYLGNYKRSDSTDQATDQTAGLVMKYQDQIIKSYFSADSGGFTEEAAAVFESLPYCQAKKELYDITKTTTDWTKEYSLESFRVMLANQNVIPASVKINKVYVDAADRTASNRVAFLSILASNGKVYRMSGPDFRYLSKVRSTLFDVTQAGATLTFAGKGYGHGVGMAQIGALQYTNQMNWTAEQILNFYYTGIVITHE